MREAVGEARRRRVQEQGAKGRGDTRGGRDVLQGRRS